MRLSDSSHEDSAKQNVISDSGEEPASDMDGDGDGEVSSAFGELSKAVVAGGHTGAEGAFCENVFFVSEQSFPVFPCFCELAKLWQMAWSLASTEDWRGL